MNTVTSCSILSSLKNVFATRMVSFDVETGEMFLQDGAAYDDAVAMLSLIESLHDTCGFEDEYERMAFYSLKIRFFATVDKDEEELRQLLMKKQYRKGKVIIPE